MGGHHTADDAYLPHHGHGSFHVRHYDLELKYNIETNHLAGVATLQIEALTELHKLTLDLAWLQVGKIAVDGKVIKKFQQRDSRVKVKLAAPVAAGACASVTVQYSGKPRPINGVHGPAGWEELTDGVLVGSQPYGAPSWFPCNDRADDKATYRVSVTVAQPYRVAGNGELVSTSSRSGRGTWVFEQREPMPTYLASLYIGRAIVTTLPTSVSFGDSGQTVMVELVHSPRLAVGAGTAFERQAEMVEFFSSVFGPYPFGVYRVVVADDDFEIPLEVQGGAQFGRNHAAPGWENERLIAHELAHQWFGNSVTARRWNDIWLHEGFACYSEWLWSQASGGESTRDQAKRHWVKLSGLPQDLVLGDPGMKDMFDDRVYKRGALLLHALHVELGDEAFFGVLRQWASRYAYAVASTDDFIALAEEVAGRSLREIFDTWLFRAPLPGFPQG